MGPESVAGGCRNAAGRIVERPQKQEYMRFGVEAAYGANGSPSHSSTRIRQEGSSEDGILPRAHFAQSAESRGKTPRQELRCQFATIEARKIVDARFRQVEPG